MLLSEVVDYLRHVRWLVDILNRLIRLLAELHKISNAATTGQLLNLSIGRVAVRVQRGSLFIAERQMRRHTLIIA